jgi:diguanylate cyclase (GGDEF)-like protein
MGGEEFVVALPNTSLTFAIEVASRLRQAIQDTDFSAYLNNASKDSSAITVSVGVAEYTSSCKSLDVLLDRADKAMYISKNSGRNQVRVWENS